MANEGGRRSTAYALNIDLLPTILAIKYEEMAGQDTRGGAKTQGAT